MNISILIKLFPVTLILFIQGCTGDFPANNLSPKMYKPISIDPSVTLAQPISITIRYPEGTLANTDKIFNNFINHTLYTAKMDPISEQNKLDIFKKQLSINPISFTQAINKSTFYSMHFYKAFKDVMKSSNIYIILEPTKLSYGLDLEVKEQRLYNKLPFSICTNFFTYVDPYFHPGTWSGLPTTYGQFVSPIVSVKTDKQVLPKSNGLYLSMDRLTYSMEENKMDIFDCNGYDASFITMVNRNGNWDDEKHNQYGINSTKLSKIPALYPYFEFKMENMENGIDMSNRFKSYAYDIVKLINSVKDKKLIDSRYSKFIAKFDVKLSERWISKRLSSEDKKALQKINDFYIASLQFVEKRSEMLFASYITSSMYRKNEQSILEEAGILSSANLMTNFKILYKALSVLQNGRVNPELTANELTSVEENKYIIQSYKEVVDSVKKQYIDLIITIENKKFKISSHSIDDLIKQLRKIY